MSTYADIKLRDGNVMPKIAYGVGTALYRQDCVEQVKLALKTQYKHLDLAEVYETTHYVGQALKETGVDPKSLYITTKAGAGMKDVRKCLDEELAALGLDSVDCFLLHWPHDFRKPEFPSMEDAWRAMLKLRDEGKTRSVGVSNFRIRDLQKLIDANLELPVINQIEYHPFLYETTEEVVQFCAKHDIKLAAYSPLAPITKFSGGSFDAALEKVTESVSERAGRKVASSQVLLRLAAQKGFVVVTTSNKEWRMKEQLEAGGLPELTEEEIESLVRAAKPSPQRTFEEHMGGLDVEY
ncbi:hypothetical protein JCM16303_001088 [Sporobolomyces ruberrimus]